MKKSKQYISHKTFTYIISIVEQSYFSRRI